MQIRQEVLLIIIGAGIVTFIPRVLPLMVLSKLKLPEWAMRWLNYVPVSIMAALIASELLIQDGKISLVSNKIELLAAVPAFLIAVRTRSLLGTVICGIVSVMILRYFF